MWDRLSGLGRAVWSLLGLGALLAVLLWIVWQFRVVFPTVVLAGAIVFLLNPLVTGLQRRGIRRLIGTAATYLGVLGLVVGSGFFMAPLVTEQVEEFSDQWPELREDMEDWLDDLSQRSKDGNWIIEIPNVDELTDQFGSGPTSAEQAEFDRVVERSAEALEEDGRPVLAADLDRVAADARTRIPDDGGIADQLRTVREVGGRIFEVGLIFILGPIMAFYLLVDLPQVGARLRALIPAGVREETLHVGHRLNVTIGGFFRGQLAIAFIVGVMVSVGLAILDLPFWLLVGMIAGAFNMVPLIGPWVGAVPGVVIALTTRDVGTALWVVVVMTAAQQIDNHFISPMVMRRTVSLHPAAVMVALLAGGSLGGFFGLLLAVPVAATVKVVVGHVWHVHVLGEPLGQVMAATADPPEVDDGVLEPLDAYVYNHLGVPPPPRPAEPVGAGGEPDPEASGGGADPGRGPTG